MLGSGLLVLIALSCGWIYRQYIQIRSVLVCCVRRALTVRCCVHLGLEMPSKPLSITISIPLFRALHLFGHCYFSINGCRGQCTTLLNCSVWKEIQLTTIMATIVRETCAQLESDHAPPDFSIFSIQSAYHLIIGLTQKLLTKINNKIPELLQIQRIKKN